ncbi:hypothetical protein ACOBR2_06165 [Telmatobacter bradus]|uniref:hypothetical protein n=1 Tax=Telmatobacter bradus TaxID=474953 RepID=UPI003B42A51C
MEFEGVSQAGSAEKQGAFTRPVFWAESKAAKQTRGRQFVQNCNKTCKIPLQGSFLGKLSNTLKINYINVFLDKVQQGVFSYR